MMTSKLMTSCLLISLVLSVYASTEPDPCLIQRKCSTKPDNVYAVDEDQCYLFRNACIYTNDLCQRRKKNEPELKVVTKEECDKKCQKPCTHDYNPVCAEYDEVLKTFPNKCDFYQTSCRTDTSYMFTGTGECPQI